MELIISSGYPSPYANVNDELAASNEGKWFPTNRDFEATGRGSGGAQQAASFDQLITLLGKREKNSIQDLGLVGHASTQTFALSGRVRGGNITFGKEGMIHPETIKAKLDKIIAVRDRFAKSASITLFACSAGAGMDLLKEISVAFQVTANGFKNEIYWCFAPQKKGDAKRGKTWYDGVGAGIHPECGSASFLTDIREWIPENSSNAGVKT